MLDKIKVFALGGLDEEGRDCYVVEINDDIFILDCGMSLPDKTIPGVDSLLPNYDYLIANKSRIKAYIISHGHDEVMGALKYFYDLAPAPIYCTSTTSQYMTNQAILYKIKTHFKFVTVEPSSTHMIAGHRVQFFQTCHNMANSVGVALTTNRGNIVYTSDYIMDYTVKDSAFAMSLPALSQLGSEPTFLLLNESKCAHLDGYCAPHHRATRKIEKFFNDKKRIFVTCFWENAFRIFEIVELAKQYKKKIFFYNLYTRQIMTFMIENKIIDVPRDMIVPSEDFLRVKQKDLVIIILGHGSEIYDEMVSLSTYRHADKRIVLGKEDIFISAAIPTDTMEVVATSSIDSLYRTGATICALTRKSVPSMHARKDDLKFFLAALRPKYYLPVRGTYTNMIDNAKLALSMSIGLNHMSVFILDNGMELVFDDKPRPSIIPNEVNHIATAPVLVDGTGISHIGSEIIEDRRKLGVDGVVVISSTVSLKEKTIIAGPDCQMRGFVFVKEAEPLLKSVTQIYVEETIKALHENAKLSSAENIIKDRARKFIKRENGREPLIIVSIMASE